ncbi:Predicted arabinose efflux permease, MFS family [Cnuella takakiae]|uniref:Predicted arabinose efflux permease, MFS family n=1 Tax=Cnuella takakiae TaxID=1302690 RepID=A0A1M5B638_9BACT|nr:MFS transporter [Cnuella takakiae]OLY93354.1 MFS transporter [Cnuella takakiae]SHF38011.1 Predicted arabinose efflux permease, MFS family [Cnuella takakiae]
MKGLSNHPPQQAAATTLPGKQAAFPALQNKNYRIYFAGQLVSVIGTWLQIVAQGWLVLQLTRSEFLIGMVAALATAPSLFFSLFGGVIVDRFPKKKILALTQLANLVLATGLGLVTIAGLTNIWVIASAAFAMGTVNSLDAPARQAFIPEVVNKEELPSAIALNSAIFNTGRVIGPVIAGVLIALVGTGWAFVANGLSYGAVLIALRFMRLQAAPPPASLQTFTAIREGIRYTVSHPVIRTVLLFAGTLSIFGWSYSTLMPAIAQKGFGLDASGLGWLYTATGLGSLLATFIVSTAARKVRPVYFVSGGATLFAICLFFFSQTKSLHTALPLLFFVGLGLIAQSAVTTTLVQSMVLPEYRGRVMSIYLLMFMGMAPVGNFEVGYLSEKLGYPTAIAINSGVVLVAALLLLAYRKQISAAYKKYKELQPAN